MKALILNSGRGSRMGDLTKQHPKCMTTLRGQETIISRQLSQLVKYDISEVVITTGPFSKKLKEYCKSLGYPLNFKYVHNPMYAQTNYIYSIYLAREVLKDDILLMHGDLVFANDVLKCVVNSATSCMTVSSAVKLPEKDFKAMLEKGKDKIIKVDTELFKNVLAAQPLYKLQKKDWFIWLNQIIAFCEQGETDCYAEKAFNQISNQCFVSALDVGELLCSEVDNIDDLEDICRRLDYEKE